MKGSPVLSTHQPKQHPSSLLCPHSVPLCLDLLSCWVSTEPCLSSGDPSKEIINIFLFGKNRSAGFVFVQVTEAHPAKDGLSKHWSQTCMAPSFMLQAAGPRFAGGEPPQTKTSDVPEGQDHVTERSTVSYVRLWAHVKKMQIFSPPPSTEATSLVLASQGAGFLSSH